MKILEVAGSGGVGTKCMGPVTNDIYQLAVQFRELGSDVTIADLRTGAARDLIPDGICVVEIDAGEREDVKSIPLSGGLPGRLVGRLLRSRCEWRNGSKFISELEKMVDLNSFDIIHVHERIPGYILQKKYGKCVYSIHTPISWCSEYHVQSAASRVDSFIKQVIGTHEISVIKKSRLSIALGKFIQKQLPDVNNIEVIPNGINLKNWTKMDKPQARKELGYGKEDKIIIFIGNAREIKGAHVLLDAVRLFSEKQKVKVIFIGSLGQDNGGSPEMRKLGQKLIQNANNLPVNFVGFVNNQTQEFRAYLSAADILVVPSLFDNQPNVILEGMAMGLPVVASNVGAIPEMVTSDVGCLVEPNNASLLADKIEYLLAQPELLSAMSEKARKRIEQKFTWRKSAEAHIRAFESIK